MKNPREEKQGSGLTLQPPKVNETGRDYRVLFARVF